MCGELRAEHAGQNVVLMGWVNRRRDHGGLIFLDLRDRTGISQVVVDEKAGTAHDKADAARSEYVVAVKGHVRLRGAGLEPVLVPTIVVEFEPPGELDAAARLLPTYAWVVITSPNGARAILAAGERVFSQLDGPRWAAIGRATQGVLEQGGIEVDLQPSRPSSSTMAAMPMRVPYSAWPRRCASR